MAEQAVQVDTQATEKAVLEESPATPTVQTLQPAALEVEVLEEAMVLVAAVAPALECPLPAAVVAEAVVAVISPRPQLRLQTLPLQ